MIKVAICVVLVLAMAQLMVQPDQADNYVDVDKCLVQYTSYLMGADVAPNPTCCAGIVQLEGMAVTTSNKCQACSCVKQATARYPNIKDNAVKTLPAKCNSPLSFPISKDFDCNSIP